MSGIALIGFTLTLALVCWWIGWNTKHLFLADLDASRESRSEDCEQIWTRCTRDEQMVLVQIARERIANPYQRPIVEKLLQKGLVRLGPDVQPFSQAFEDFLRERKHDLREQITDWQDVNALRSWRYWRLILVSSVAAIGFFLLATQPGLQSSVMAIATGLTGVVTAGAKLREAVASWFARKAAG
jgi:hypothetical protein